MKMTGYMFNDVAFREFSTDTMGGIAPEMQRQALRVAEAVRVTIGRPWPGGAAPPPGPPFVRTETLQKSVAPDQIEVDLDGMVIAIRAPAIDPRAKTSKGEDPMYANTLVNLGYKFYEESNLPPE